MSAPITAAQWAEARRTATEVLPGLVDKVGLPKALISYQARTLELLEDTACRVLFIEKSRRIGLTFGFASYAALRAGRAKEAGGMDVMYISYSQEMTREFIDACAMWARAFSNAALAVDEFLFDDSDKEGERSIQAFRIRFASGFEILALSSAPRTLRGKQGVVMIDEAAFVDSLPELLKAALAFLMWGGQVVVCSTHNGTENEFNKQIQNILAGRSKYSHIRIDFDQALKEGLYERICLVNGNGWTAEGEAKWRQEIIDFYGDGADEELFCIPTAGTGAWLPAPLIEARMTIEAPIIRIELPRDFLHRTRLERAMLIAPTIRELAAAIARLDRDRTHAFGFDFARVADLSVGTLLATSRLLKREEALTLEMRNVPGDEQKLFTRMILKGAPRLVGAAFDATGMGWTVAEDMGREFGFRDPDHPGGLIEAIKFSTDWYRFNMPPLKAAFEDDAIALAKDDEHLADLRLVRVVAGVPKVPDVRTGEASKKRHGDFAVALALAHYASRQQWHEYDYQSIRDLAAAAAAGDDDDDSDFGRRHW
ncbi:Mu-like prophage FluMu protein Gp28 [Neorhizobium galegae bv. orientalis]|nr:Mu-like prophage FluMu protein Gp28 [Neorhizobium galegae bv. orientalis]